MPSSPSSSTLTSSFDSSLLQPNEASLRRSSGTGNAAPGGTKLSKAAVDFESVLLGQWLQSAQKSFATVPGSEEDEDAGGDQMLGFATQQLAQSIARSGGLGIAKIVEHALEKTDKTSASTAAQESAKPLQQSAKPLQESAKPVQK